MHWTLCVVFLVTLTCHSAAALNQSDGYNIGVVLGSIIGALLIVGIAAFLFYMFCIRRWMGIGEPAELGYAKQNNYNLKKQTGRPSKFGYGVQGKAPPYVAGGGGGGGGAVPREGGRRQGTANDVYQPEGPQYAAGARYEAGETGVGPSVMLSASGSDHQLRRHSPANASYSSESEMRAAGRQGFEVTTSRTYQQRTYTQTSAGTSGGDGSPISAAYLGTGV